MEVNQKTFQENTKNLPVLPHIMARYQLSNGLHQHSKRTNTVDSKFINIADFVAFFARWSSSSFTVTANKKESV
jgi:hypothetical protein